MVYDISLILTESKQLVYTYKSEILPMAGDIISNKDGETLYEVINRMFLGAQNSYSVVIFVKNAKFTVNLS
jgi:hypothetical protein